MKTCCYLPTVPKFTIAFCFCNTLPCRLLSVFMLFTKLNIRLSARFVPVNTEKIQMFNLATFIPLDPVFWATSYLNSSQGETISKTTIFSWVNSFGGRMLCLGRGFLEDKRGFFVRILWRIM